MIIEVNTQNAFSFTATERTLGGHRTFSRSIYLVEAFIANFSTEYGKNATWITTKALTRLERAAWPGNIRQLRSSVQMAVALATTDILSSQDFPDIYPELAKSLISIWYTLPSQTQEAIWETLPKSEPLDIENMNQSQILHVVTQRRIDNHRTLREATASLDIDIRTLQRYAQRGESDD